MKTCKHDFKNGRSTCFWCGAPRPVLDGRWPTGTWFQERFVVVRMREAQEKLARRVPRPAWAVVGGQL